MIDIVKFERTPSAAAGVVEDTPIYKAKNIMTTQIGFLKYASAFGLDLNLFFDATYQIQTASFMAYTTKKLAENYINIASIKKNIDEFVSNYTLTFQKAEGN